MIVQVFYESRRKKRDKLKEIMSEINPDGKPEKILKTIQVANPIVNNWQMIYGMMATLLMLCTGMTAIPN